MNILPVRFNRLTPALIGVAVALLLNTILWIWQWNKVHGLKVELGKGFYVEMLHTNGLDGVGLFDRRTRQPIWTAFDVGGTGAHNTFDYFFEGKAVLGVFLPSNQPPRLEVILYGQQGEMKSVWWNRCRDGLFSDRVVYEGGKPRMDVWINEAWLPTEKRQGKRGVVISGEWNRLGFTNCTWITEPP
jgi:hypothetical protein